MVPPVSVILDNIRSVHNVGSIFRTCDAAGVGKLVLCGTTPTPIDRFGRTRPDLAKVALGAEKTVPWEYVPETEQAVRDLRKEGVRIIAIEQTASSIDYRAPASQEASAFIFGNEVEGISEGVLALCDEVVDIPMRGEKESLNVSVAVGIILFRTLRE
jgi:23S rRNA (guanosine2251-2'-O)-methyltransferase